MPPHCDLTSPAHAFMAADCAIPLVAERSIMALTARRFLSIFFSPGRVIECPCFTSTTGQQEVGQGTKHCVQKMTSEITAIAKLNGSDETFGATRILREFGGSPKFRRIFMRIEYVAG
jgi:hypothetical protein